jgi:hypothetical protein
MLIVIVFVPTFIDPDVTTGDGVYSGYFTDFLRTSGQYRVRISAVRDGKISFLNSASHASHITLLTLSYSTG